MDNNPYNLATHPPPVWTGQHWISSGPPSQQYQYHLMGQPQMESCPSMQQMPCQHGHLSILSQPPPHHVPSFSGASYTAQKEASTISSGNEVSPSHVTVTPVTSVGDVLAEVKSERHWSPIPYVDVSAQDTEDLMQRKKLETERRPLPREWFEAILLTKKQLKAKAKMEFTKMLRESEEDIMNTFDASAWVYNFTSDMGWWKKFEGDKRYQAVNEVDVRKGLYQNYMFDLQKKMVAKHAIDEKKFISTFNQESRASQDVAAEWQACQSVDDDRIFYYNKITGKSNWEKPLELMTPLERDNADAYPLWKVITTSKGENYFYNTDTGESRWTLPDNVKLACEQAEKEASSLIAATPVADVLAEVKLENSSLTGAPKASVGVSTQDSEAKDDLDIDVSFDNVETDGSKRSRPHGSDRNISKMCAYSPRKKRKKVSQ